MFGSGCLHSAYFTTLQRGYAEGDLSVVYPLARGTGPALSVLAAVVILGERPGPLALVGAAHHRRRRHLARLRRPRDAVARRRSPSRC